MGLLRKTYAEINLKNVRENVNKIINKYKGYNYYFGVVKADCYGHGYKKTVQAKNKNEARKELALFI